MSQIEELYDYDVLRRITRPTMFVVRLDRPTLVLGGNQSADVLRADARSNIPTRRRRGGGGVVLLQPDDLWVDFWLPADDPRWHRDVHVASLTAGRWWRDAIAPLVDGELILHETGLEGEPAERVACFAGRGPGELFLNERKVLGITQWRVREGVFLSGVIHARSSNQLLEFLESPPVSLERALDHHTTSSLGIEKPDEAVDALRTSGEWHFRQLFLTA